MLWSCTAHISSLCALVFISRNMKRCYIPNITYKKLVIVGTGPIFSAHHLTVHHLKSDEHCVIYSILLKHWTDYHGRVHRNIPDMRITFKKFLCCQFLNCFGIEIPWISIITFLLSLFFLLMRIRPMFFW